MKADTFNFKSEKLFPFQFQILGIIFLFLGMVLILYSPYFAPILIILGILILTAFRGIEFDRSAKTYRDYNSFLYMRQGSLRNYDSVKEIFINSSDVSQKIYTRVTEGTTMRYVEYNAYLEFGDGTKLYLTSKKDKNAIIEKTSGLSDFLQVEVRDYKD